MIIDKNIAQKIYNIETYCEFFYPEIKNFINEKQKEEILKNLDENILNDFDLKRKEGENDKYICKLIRNDSVEEFIALYNKLNYSTDKMIEKSIFETNDYLQKTHTLSEYSAFFGSYEIFLFLYMNGIELNQSIWFHAIHGKNPNIIHFLEENHIEPESYSLCFFESIKCHHDDLANYFLINQLNNEIPSQIYIERKKHIKYSTIFNSVRINISKRNSYLIPFEHYHLFIAKTLLENQNIDIKKPFVCYKSESNDGSLSWFKNTPFSAAVESENLEIVKLLASKENINVNYHNIITNFNFF